MEANQTQYDLNRFIKAQSYNYDNALRELQNGRKTSHWIWYIFPQQKGLGRSYNSKFYGLDDIAEATEYIQHPVLSSRLRKCCQALLLHKDESIRSIMGSHIDVVKLRTSMKLFNEVCPHDVFEEVLKTFFKKTYKNYTQQC